MTDIVLTVDLIPMTTPGPVTPARGTKRRHQEPDEGGDDGEGDDVDDSINVLKDSQKKMLRSWWDGTFPFREFPTGAEISSVQGAQGFVTQYASQVKRWHPRFNLPKWVDGRVKNQKGIT